MERSGDIWEVLIVTDSPDFIGEHQLVITAFDNVYEKEVEQAFKLTLDIFDSCELQEVVLTDLTVSQVNYELRDEPFVIPLTVSVS